MYLYVIFYPSYLVVEMIKITVLFSLCGRLKLLIQWLPSNFVILKVMINTYMNFPADTTINCNKATFWWLYYNKQMAALGGKSTYLSVVEELKTNLMSLVIFISLIICSTCFGH